MTNTNTLVLTLKDNLTKYIPKLMNKYNVPGLALAMFRNDEIILNLEFGVKNSSTKEPVDASTVFEGASFTKPLIAYAALKLCQKGLLSLDTPLRNYLQEPYKSDPPNLHLVTLRHVLNHTSGFPFLMLAKDEPLELEFIPGSEYYYSSAAFNYLSFVMNHILQNSLEEYLRKTILQPLQMDNSSFIWEDRFESQGASPHNHLGEHLAKWKPNHVVAACSIHTTPIDFAKFMMFILNQAKNPSTDAINMFSSPYQAEPHILSTLGWGIEKTTDGDFVYHVGNNLTFKSLAIANNEKSYGIVFMTNGFNGFKIFESVLDLTIGGNHRALANFEEFESEDEKFNYYGESYMANWWKND